MEWIVGKVFIGFLWLFLTAEEFLFASVQILDNTKSGSCENDFIIGLSEMKAVLVSVTGITVNMLDLISELGLRCIELSISWWLLKDLLEEELLSLLLLGFTFFHSSVIVIY